MMDFAKTKHGLEQRDLGVQVEWHRKTDEQERLNK